jgi:hypothetical protein
MTGDPGRDFYDPPVQPIRPVRVQATPVVVVLLMLIGTLVGGWYLAKKAGWLTPVERVSQGAASTEGIGIKSRIAYPPEPASFNGATRDLTQEQLDALKRELEAQRRLLEAMAKKPAPAPPPPAQTKPAAPPPAPKPHRPMQFITNKVEKTAADDPDQHDLAPGATKLPCIVETAMHSEIESHFTAKVRNDVYDTATGGHLLVPQGSTILGEYHSAELAFGNERLPSVSLTLALPDGRTVDLGKAPVMNQRGMAGLVSRVDQHWWRNLGAVFIMGVLRGGQQAVAVQMGGAGSASGAMAQGLAGSASQFGQQTLGKAIDTRPTILVDSGELCQVLLTKPLTLAAYGAGR